MLMNSIINFDIKNNTNIIINTSNTVNTINIILLFFLFLVNLSFLLISPPNRYTFFFIFQYIYDREENKKNPPIDALNQ